MKKLIFGVLILSFSVASAASQYISDKDQQYYRNDPTDGVNKRERIDSLVVEVNKIYGELKTMKEEMSKLRKELDDMKAKK